MSSKNGPLVCRALFILLTSLSFYGCEPAADRDAVRLASDSAAMAEVKRIEALLGAMRPVTRLDVDSLRRMREQYPASTKIRQLLQGAFIKREDWEAAEKLISEIPDSERTSSDRLTLAKVYIKQGKFRESIDVLNQIEGTTAERLEAAALKGQAEFYTGNLDSAAISLESVRTDLIAQKRADDLAILGTVYLRRGERERAVEVLQKAVEAAPDNISANNALSRAYAAAGEEEKAASIRARLDSINDKIADAERKRSRIVPLFYQLEDAYAKGEYDKAMRLIHQIRPEADAATSATLYQYLAAVYKAQGKESEARQALADATKMTPK
jgi:tetratricopeptide (TPR) repeat protein